MASFSARRADHFFKKLSKTHLPFRFCKIGLRNTLFIFGRKNGRFLCLFCFFVCFVATLSDFGLFLKKLKYSSDFELRTGSTKGEEKRTKKCLFLKADHAKPVTY